VCVVGYVVEVAAVERLIHGTHDLYVLPRHRLRSITFSCDIAYAVSRAAQSWIEVGAAERIRLRWSSYAAIRWTETHEPAHAVETLSSVLGSHEGPST
jgi:hypothetical protein